MNRLDLRDARRVRIEVTTADGVRYKIELGPAMANLGIEMDTYTDTSRGWVDTFPTGNAEVTLTAHGRLIERERRAAPRPRRPRGGRLPAPSMDTACTRCGSPRQEHGGPKRMGACPSESGLRAKRFSVA